jgi:hypothetical protein
MSTGAGKRARRVIRLSALGEFLGVGRSAIDEMVGAGLLHPFPITPRGRAKVVFMEEVAELQEKAAAAAKANANQEDDDA